MSGSDIDRHLGRKIKDAREQAGRTQAELAQRLQIEESTLEAMEAGEVRIASLNLARIARDLELPLSWFFEGLPGQDVFDAPRARRSV
nr:helix-turn-helix transcriptional regulator [Hyphomonas sp. Mor2]